METANRDTGGSSEMILTRLDSLGDYSRRNNLRFEGITEQPNETLEHTAERRNRFITPTSRVRVRFGFAVSAPSFGRWTFRRRDYLAPELFF